MGWGRIGWGCDDTLKPPKTLQELQVPLITVPTCRERFGKCSHWIKNDMLCPGSRGDPSGPCQMFQMAITFHNQRVVDSALTDHAVFLRENDGLSRRMVDCLTMDPNAMAEQFEEQRRWLLGRCREEMREPEKETLLMALEAEMNQEAETFLETYRRRYQHHTTNQRAMDRARRDHADFLREKDGLSQRMADCLTVDPSAMAEQFMEQRRSLLERCQKEMKEPEETLMTALKAELTREAETFLGTYRRHYQSHNINQRVMDRARQDHADFLREKDGLSQRMGECLTVTPSAMAEQLVEKRRSLLGRCREEMKEPEETLLTAVEAELTREADIFLETSRERYLCHLTNLGQKLGQGLILLLAAKSSFRD
ncbi:unnamed protein product [Lepidochelys olivacea]